MLVLAPEVPDLYRPAQYVPEISSRKSSHVKARSIPMMAFPLLPYDPRDHASSFILLRFFCFFLSLFVFCRGDSYGQENRFHAVLFFVLYVVSCRRLAPSVPKHESPHLSV